MPMGVVAVSRRGGVTQQLYRTRRPILETMMVKAAPIQRPGTYKLDLTIGDMSLKPVSGRQPTITVCEAPAANGANGARGFCCFCC